MVKLNEGGLCEGKACIGGSSFHGKSFGPYSLFSNKLVHLVGLRGNGCCSTFNMLEFSVDPKKALPKSLNPFLCVLMPILCSSKKDGNSCARSLLSPFFGKVLTSLVGGDTTNMGFSLQKTQRPLEKPKEGLIPIMLCSGDVLGRVEVSDGFQCCES